MMASFISSDGIRLAFYEHGEGPAVLCLSGLTRNALDFEYALPHLAGLRIIRLDYRGRGASEWADPSTYTVPVETRDVVELLDHLGLERVAILGTSRGGLIAMSIAAFARKRLSGICLNDVGPVLSPVGLDAIRGYVGIAPTARTLAQAADERACLFPDFRGVPRSRWQDEAAHSYIETEGGLELRYDPRLRETVLSTFDSPMPDLWPLFAQLDGLPLALIRGANSNLLDAETAEEMRRRRPDMVYAEVPDRGHVPFLDEPEAVDAIRRWRELFE